MAIMDSEDKGAIAERVINAAFRLVKDWHGSTARVRASGTEGGLTEVDFDRMFELAALFHESGDISGPLATVTYSVVEEETQ